MANPFIAPCTSTLTDHVQEKDLVCPYNKRHSFKVSSMQKHLAKCRKEHLGATGGKATCPYNEAHMMPMVELECHKVFCADRFLSPECKSTFEPRTESLSSIPIKTREFKPSEDWDKEECPTYDPSIRLMTGDLVVKPDFARFGKDSRPPVPISVNCRLGPPVPVRRPSSSAQEHAATSSYNRFESHETEQASRYQYRSESSAQWPQDQAEWSHTRIPLGHRDYTPSTASAQVNRAYRDTNQNTEDRSYKKYELPRYVPPPRSAASHHERVSTTETSQYGMSRQTHGSVPIGKPKSRPHPRSREDHDASNRNLQMQHEGQFYHHHH